MILGAFVIQAAPQLTENIEQSASQTSGAGEDSAASARTPSVASGARKKFVSTACVAGIVFGIVAATTTGLFLQWKKESVVHSLPVASRDCVEKWDQYLKGTDNPDCLLLGSSVFLVPATYIEEQRSGHTLTAREADSDLARRAIRCDSAPELQRQLIQRLNKSVTIRNLAVAGSNVSDYLLELKALHAAGHKPKLVVCGLGVRDFVQSFFRMDSRNNPAARLLAPNEKDAPNLNEALFSDFREGFVVSLFRNFRNTLHEKQAVLTNNAPVMHVAQSDEAVATTLTQTLTDAPKRPAFIEGQIEAYKEMLKFCADNHIKLLIVEVPKRTGWAGVVDDALVTRIKTTIAGSCNAYGIAYRDIEGGFSQDDFADDIHPNVQGGVKMFGKVADAIVQTGVF